MAVFFFSSFRLDCDNHRGRLTFKHTLFSTEKNSKAFLLDMVVHLVGSAGAKLGWILCVWFILNSVLLFPCLRDDQTVLLKS